MQRTGRKHNRVGTTVGNKMMSSTQTIAKTPSRNRSPPKGKQKVIKLILLLVKLDVVSVKLTITIVQWLSSLPYVSASWVRTPEEPHT